MCLDNQTLAVELFRSSLHLAFPLRRQCDLVRRREIQTTASQAVRLVAAQTPRSGVETCLVSQRPRAQVVRGLDLRVVVGSSSILL